MGPRVRLIGPMRRLCSEYRAETDATNLHNKLLSMRLFTLNIDTAQMSHHQSLWIDGNNEIGFFHLDAFD